MLLRNLILTLLTVLVTPPLVRAGDVVRRELSLNEIYNTFQAEHLNTPHGPFTMEGKSNGFAVSTMTGATFQKPATLLLASLDNPPVQPGPYRLEGEVAYGGIDGNPDLGGDAYLEMWSTFADGTSYFSRTLAGAGPLQKFTGSSLSRPFWLPFNPNPCMKLKNLTLNLVMTGPGHVDFNGQLLLTQDEPTAAVAEAAPLGDPHLQLSAADLAALQMNPTLADAMNKRSYLQARLLTLQKQFGSEHPEVLGAEQALRDSQAQLDQQVTATLLAKTREPRWLAWLDARVAAWWWGMLLPLISISLVRTAKSRFHYLVVAAAVVVGELCFGWGMAGLGSGDEVARFAVPLVMGIAVLLATLVMQPWVRRQQAVELRRIAVMDAA